MTSVDWSVLREVSHRCGRGHGSTVRHWVVIDARMRHDLHRELRRRLVRCPRCGQADPPTEATLVLCDSSIALLVPGAAGVPDTPPEWLQALGWDAWPEGPPLLLIADRASAAVAVTRSLADDLADPGRVEAEFSETYRPATVAAYMGLLNDLAAATAHRRRMQLIGEATITDDETAFLAMLERHPELLDDETLAMLDAERDAQPDVRLDLGRRLLVEARADPGRAWQDHHERVMAIGGELTDAAESWQARLDAATDPDDVIAIAESALAFAAETGNDPAFVTGVLAVRAQAHLRAHSGRRDQHLAAAAEDYRQALALLPTDHPGRADLLMNAGTAIAQQIG
jgi:hypothetical protein